MRIVLPDRPGALGAVATALGVVGADILNVEVIGRRNDCAIDDFVVEVPPGQLADTLVSAARSVPEVWVETIRPYAALIDPYRELELLDALGTAPHDSLALLADGVARLFRAGWAMVLDPPVGGSSAVQAASPSAPELESLRAPWWPPRPARVLPADEDWCPPDWERLETELAVAPLGAGALLVGRPAFGWLPSELVRLQHLAAIAATVTAGA